MVLIKSMRAVSRMCLDVLFPVSTDACGWGVWKAERGLCLFTADLADVGRNIKVFMLSFSVSAFRV